MATSNFTRESERPRCFASPSAAWTSSTCWCNNRCIDDSPPFRGASCPPSFKSPRFRRLSTRVSSFGTGRRSLFDTVDPSAEARDSFRRALDFPPAPLRLPDGRCTESSGCAASSRGSEGSSALAAPRDAASSSAASPVAGGASPLPESGDRVFPPCAKVLAGSAFFEGRSPDSCAILRISADIRFSPTRDPPEERGAGLS
mmetsp:Transcript_868/g.2245  ORF Transcript_868/g.2245 Transcript_868/m.2245 type:complete len:201 (-) Transcript_868:2656-3258(-)